jgi:hypothetical protein
MAIVTRWRGPFQGAESENLQAMPPGYDLVGIMSRAAAFFGFQG